jgi:phosphoribosylformimino-5-aminoimidazole carboxamide ribotide isomerase
LADYCGLPIIASGGVTDLEDVRALKGKTGILGAITGRAIYEGTLNLRDAQILLDEDKI